MTDLGLRGGGQGSLCKQGGVGGVEQGPCSQETPVFQSGWSTECERQGAEVETESWSQVA